MQGDQVLEVNGMNVRDSNQKDVAQLINELDGAIVLLLGRIPSLAQAIVDWSRKKSNLHWRTRTSTWSSYCSNNKDKVQNQRPSLPISQDTTVYFSLHTPDNDEPNSPFNQFFPSLVGQTMETDEGMISRTSSIRSRVRLSIVVEDTKQSNNRQETEGEEEEEQDDDEDEEDEDEEDDDGDSEEVSSTDNHLLPSIQVTEY